MDPRIRIQIRSKISVIRNTALYRLLFWVKTGPKLKNTPVSGSPVSTRASRPPASPGLVLLQLRAGRLAEEVQNLGEVALCDRPREGTALLHLHGSEGRLHPQVQLKSRLSRHQDRRYHAEERQEGRRR